MNGYFGIIRPPYILILSAFATYLCIKIFSQSFNYKHILKYFWNQNFIFQINNQLC